MIWCLIENLPVGVSDDLLPVGTIDVKSYIKTANAYQTPLALCLDLSEPNYADLQLDTVEVAKLEVCGLIKHAPNYEKL